jgi:membrane protein
MSIKTNIKKIYEIIMDFFDRLDKDHVYLISAGIAFNILMYQIPLFLLVTFVVDFFVGFETLATQLEVVLKDFLPPTANSEKYISTIINEILNILKHSSFFGVIGLGVLIWISSALIASLRYSINTVFSIPPKKSAFLDMLNDMLLVILIPFLFIIYTFLLPLVEILINVLSILTPDVADSFISNSLLSLTSLATGFLIYYFVYSYVPSAKVKREKRLFASILNTVLIEISRHIFGWYLVSVSNYGKYYGTYAAIVSIAIWIYYFAFIFIVSAEISQMYFDYKEKKEVGEELFKE